MDKTTISCSKKNLPQRVLHSMTVEFQEKLIKSLSEYELSLINQFGGREQITPIQLAIIRLISEPRGVIETYKHFFRTRGDINPETGELWGFLKHISMFEARELNALKALKDTEQKKELEEAKKYIESIADEKPKKEEEE